MRVALGTLSFCCFAVQTCAHSSTVVLMVSVWRATVWLHVCATRAMLEPIVILVSFLGERPKIFSFLCCRSYCCASVNCSL